MNTRMFFGAVALAAMAGTAIAGVGGVEGTITDQETGKIIANRVVVAIQCGNVRKTATTDAAGHFSISGLPQGNCTLTTATGTYQGTSVAVSVADGSISTVLVSVMSKATFDRQEAERKKWEKESQRQNRMRKPQMNMDFGGVAGVEGGVMGGMGAGRGAMAPMAEAPRPMPAPPPRVATKPSAPMHAHAPAATPPMGAAAAPPPPPPAQAGPMGGGGGKHKVAVAMPDRAMKLDEKRKLPLGNRRIQAGRPIGGEMINGWAPVRVFPVPQYTKAYDGPRDDFRETIYWNGAVETDASGNADVTFAASDAVTSFRARAEGFGAGGIAGGGDVAFQSKLPLTLDARLPVEVTAGDTIQLPVVIANETDQPLDAKLDAQFGAAFKLAQNPAGAIHLEPKAKKSLLFPLEVVATEGNADVSLAIATRGLKDELKKTIRVVPRGFPFESSASGTAHNGETSHHSVDLAGALPGSIRATVTMYPSPVAAMTQGMAAMIREPGGCFEQTSATNYPNVMILAYLAQNEAADPQLVQTARGKLEHGYKILTGYETPEKGYEWFGKNPGHEALTAYGLMEFADMGKVYDVDRKMVDRTADWLMSRRDHKGGFQRSSQALDSFGRAGEQTTNAYIMWALAEAKRTQSLGQELGVQKTLGDSTKDPYLLALAANTELLTAPKAAETTAMVKRLAGMQAKDGSFTGASETITKSGGDSLVIETTALAELAMLKASATSGDYEGQIRSAADWLNSKRGGYGSWGNTQATILGLKALTAYSEHSRQMQSGGSATLVINGKDAGTIKFDKGRRDALVWPDAAKLLAPGKNTLEVRLNGPASLPYSIAIDYRSAQPQTSAKAKVDVTTQLLKTQAKMGDGVTLRAHVENKTQDGVPMTLARIGLPGGTVFQTWQLKELRDKGLIDFYETRPREVILYWRALPPGAKKDVDLNLLAQTPGTYEAPASSAYLYYTAEDKTWVKPVAITIAQ